MFVFSSLAEGSDEVISQAPGNFQLSTPSFINMFKINITLPSDETPSNTPLRGIVSGNEYFGLSGRR